MVLIVGVSSTSAAALERAACAKANDSPAAPSAPEDPIAPPAPRAGLFLSLGLGVDAVFAGWREPNPEVHEGVRQLGPALRLAVGVQIRSGTALFVDGAGTVPAVLPGWGIEMAGIGGGVDRFVRPDGPWHFRVSARRAWAYRSRAFQAPIRLIPPPIRTIDEIVWLEIGIGHIRRGAQTEAGWMVSVLGGPLWTGNGTGWIGGLSLAHVWSRS